MCLRLFSSFSGVKILENPATRKSRRAMKDIATIPWPPRDQRTAMALPFCYLLAILMTLTFAANDQQMVPKTPFDSVAAEGSGTDISAMYIMGDSSVDCGENTLFYPLLHRNLSLVPCNGSDSTLLPYQLAEKMGLKDIPTFYSQNGSVEGLRRGLNYGSAKATIMNPGSQSLQSLNQQLRQVLETFQLLQLHFGEDSVQHFIKSSIFYLSFGKDDYIDLFLGNASGIMLKYSGQEFARILVSQMVNAIRNLYDANARKIIWMAILPLGCTPHVVWEWHNSTYIDHGTGCVEEINELVLECNRMLDERIAELHMELPDAQIIFCDVYHGILEIVTNAAGYGFSDTKNACCGTDLQGEFIGCLSAQMACNQSSAYVWWDIYNPTPAVNALLANAAWSGNICHPMKVQDLVHISVSPLT